MRLTRRSLLGWTPLATFWRRRPFRFAICNETFAGKSFRSSCRLAKGAGYTGIEIAPAALPGNPALASVAQRMEYRRIMSGEGIAFVGLHALLSAGAGLHFTTPDAAVRASTWEYCRRLIDSCVDLGDGALMVLGSGKERSAVKGSSVEDARKRLCDGLAAIAPHAAERGVLLLLEPLSPQFTNVITTLAEAAAVLRQVNNPAVQSMFDVHNAVAETEPHDQLIRKYAGCIRHVHINEMDGRHPGTGQYDFAPLLQTLRDIDYAGWISLEVFRFEPSGEAIATETMALLRRIEGGI